MFTRGDHFTKSILQITETDRERFERYRLNWLYYRGHQYLDELGKWYAQEHQLFKHMRRVFDCVTHCVDTDARFSMKQRIDIDAEESFKKQILEIWSRSNIQVEKYKMARYAANLGDVFLILQDLDDGPGVIPRIIVANSEDMTVYKDPDDQNQTLYAKQSYIFVDENGKARNRDWLYFPDRIERYTDEKMDEGFPKAHQFGETPVVHIKAIDIGEAYGLSSWHNVQSQIDAVNELGSFANRIMLRYADPTLVGTGMTPGEQPVIRKGLNEDNVYYLPNPESRLEILEYQGNALPHILEQMQKIEENIKDQLPEMSLAKIREQAGLSGYAVSLHAAELIAKIEELRGNLAHGLEWINALALKAMHRSSAPIEEFENRIVFEPVLPEDTTEKLATWRTEIDIGLVGRRELWRRQGLTEEEIEELKAEVDAEMEEMADQGYARRVGADLAELERQLLGDELP